MGVHLVYEIEIVATNLHESDRGTKLLPKERRLGRSHASHKPVDNPSYRSLAA